MKNVIKQAKDIQKRYSPFITIAKKVGTGKKGKLSGIAVSVKDNICTEGMQSTAGSRILEGYVPPFDATVVERAKQAGATIVGKTAQDEFGFGTLSI
jgi:aspartyl-tRNA(Asn)/glutamyl-tRNA(Gln) amidotransferase subunit A